MQSHINPKYKYYYIINIIFKHLFYLQSDKNTNSDTENNAEYWIPTISTKGAQYRIEGTHTH